MRPRCMIRRRGRQWWEVWSICGIWRLSVRMGRCQRGRAVRQQVVRGRWREGVAVDTPLIGTRCTISTLLTRISSICRLTRTIIGNCSNSIRALICSRRRTVLVCCWMGQMVIETVTDLSASKATSSWKNNATNNKRVDNTSWMSAPKTSTIHTVRVRIIFKFQ